MQHTHTHTLPPPPNWCQVKKPISGCTRWPRSIKKIKNNNLIKKYKKVIIWDLNRLTFVRRLPTHCAPISAIAIDQLSGQIYTCAGTTVSAWDNNGDLLATKKTSESLSSSIYSIALAKGTNWSHNSLIVTGHRDGTLCFWSVVPGDPFEDRHRAMSQDNRRFTTDDRKRDRNIYIYIHIILYIRVPVYIYIYIYI